MSAELVVSVSFWVAFVLDLLIIFYAFNISKRLGGGGFLGTVIVLIGVSALVFGIHHIMEIFLERSALGAVIAETVEAIAAIVLVISVYKLNKGLTSSV